MLLACPGVRALNVPPIETVPLTPVASAPEAFLDLTFTENDDVDGH
jgi:hypothetical protein